MLCSSYDEDDSNFETAVRRGSKRKKDLSPLDPKKVIYFDIDFDSSKSSKARKQEYDFHWPESLSKANIPANMFARTQYEINRGLLAIQEYATLNALLDEN